MGKYDLQPSSRRHAEVIEPQVLPAASKKSPKGDESFLLKKEFLTGSIEIAKMVVGAKRDRDPIEATADAEVRKVAAEIDKITAEANAFVVRTQAESEAWNRRFDKESAEREGIVHRVMASLDAHPEWSDAIKGKIIDLAVAAFESKGTPRA